MQVADGLGRVRFDRVGDRHQAADGAVPGHHHHGFAFGLQTLDVVFGGTKIHVLLFKPARLAHHHEGIVDPRLDAGPAGGLEFGRGLQGQALTLGMGHDGPPQGVLGALLHRGADPQQFPVIAGKSCQRHEHRKPGACPR